MNPFTRILLLQHLHKKIRKKADRFQKNQKYGFRDDDHNIYISGRFSDSNPDSIDVTLMRRDNVVESDWFFVYLDTYNDDRTGYFFAVNAGGSIADGTLYNDSWDDDSWDGIWENKTTVDENGWNLEMRIPFTQLRFNESDKMVWGINLNRDIKRKHEMSFYVMVPKKESGFVSKFADLEGLDGIKPKQRLEILPYVVQKHSTLSMMKMIHSINQINIQHQ